MDRLVFRLPEMDEQPAPIVIVVLGPPAILNHYGKKASLLEFDGEQPKENIAQELVMAIQSMPRICIAAAKNVQSRLEDNL